MTSKAHTLNDLSNLQKFGYRGEALASICQCCKILVIESCAAYDGVTYISTVSIKRRNIVVKSAATRPSVGTTVTVSGLFYNLPVRKQKIQPIVEIEKIKHQMEAIALIHPHVSVSLRYCLR